MDEDNSSFTKVMNRIKSLGLQVIHPHSELLKEGNEVCEVLKPYEIVDYDCEDFYHKPYPAFTCHIPGCERTFETVVAYDAHYKTRHSYTCQECRRNLPNAHLLDLHILETHDFYFLEQAKTKPMFRCFSEECTECFKDPAERKDHCITVHKYPSDFRYDALRRKRCFKKKRKPKIPKEEGKGKSEKMEVEADGSDTNPENKTTAKCWKYKNFTFGRSNTRRKPVFVNFSKDLMKSLPDA